MSNSHGPGSDCEYVAGWATRTYQIDDRPSAGLTIYFSADRVRDRFPFYSRLAYAALAPVRQKDQQPDGAVGG